MFFLAAVITILFGVWDTIPLAVVAQPYRSSTDRSQVRYALHSLFWFGFLTLVLCNMQSELWMSDELHDLQMQSGIEVFNVWGEGFSPTMGADGGSALALQPSFFLDDDPKQHGPWPSQQHTAVQKRSYKRACRRAIQTGCAWFHGQCIPLHEFPTALVETLTQSMLPHSHACSPVRSHGPPKTRSKPCINVLNWNPGGLGESRFAELKTWLTDTDFNVVVIPETRWSFQNEWEDDHWCYFHSVDSHRVSGVLVMVSKALCRSHNMLWTSVIPGRLVHIRLMGLSRNIDIVACYQASTDTPSRLGASKDVRAEVFQSLDDLISTLPQRNVLLVAGDFQLQLTACPRLLWNTNL